MSVILSKLVSAFLLPPGVFILLFAWLGWLLRPNTLRRVRRVEIRSYAPQSLDEEHSLKKGRHSNSNGRKLPFYLACTAAVLLYLFSIEPVSDLLLKPLEDRYPPLHYQEGEGTSGGLSLIDAVVVLGGGTVARSPEKGSDDLREESLKRLLYGIRIYREMGKVQSTPPLLILSGGRVFDGGQEAEATIMGRYAGVWGVDPGSIRVDPDSRTTWENARYVASRFHPRKVLLVTSAYHMPRAVWCFSRQGIEVIPAPTDYKVNRGIPYDLESFLPTLHGFQHVRKALHEYLGSFLYGVVYR